jgi:hypothetical protein
LLQHGRQLLVADDRALLHCLDLVEHLETEQCSGRGASDHEFVGDAAYIHLEIEALHRRAVASARAASRLGLHAGRRSRQGVTFS